LFLLAAGTAYASPHPNPYSYPYATLNEGALEAEQYIDLVPVRVSRENADGTLDGVMGVRSVLQTELEYGITDRLEFGFYMMWRQAASANTPFLRFQGVKQRLRYRFADEGEWPIDVGLYLEIAELDNEFEFEEKLLLSKRFGDFTAVANLWVEQEWYYQTDDYKYIYNPTVAVNYQVNPKFFVGLEYWGRGRFDKANDVSDTNGNINDAPQKSHHYLGPTVLLQSGKLALSVGAYVRMDSLGESVQVGDSFGRLWIRTIVGLDL
jgi:hypothetical protein